MGLLASEECARIREAGLEVLRDVGVRVDDEGIVILREEAGAAVTDENTVRIPAELVERALDQCRRVARYADRRGRLWQLAPGGDTMVLTGNALYITRNRLRAEPSRATWPSLHRSWMRASTCTGCLALPSPTIRHRHAILSACESWLLTRPST